MNLFFQKDVLVNHVKNFIQLFIRIKNFILESPPGYLEYRQAILSKDKHFNYLENEYFKRHVLPYMSGHSTLENFDHSSNNHQQLFDHHSTETFRVNPVTGLPMIGAYDAGGNPFGFNYNQSFHNHLNNSSNLTNTHTNCSLNSFDYWK